MKEFDFWLSRKINYPLMPPQVLQISLTYRCNLRCKMCNIAGLLPQEEELSTEQVYRVINEAKDYGIKEILLTGGEPFLRKDIFQICNYSAEKKLRSIITTNGICIDSHLANAIAKSGIGHIHFSLDGLEATNDFFRGDGTFGKVREAVYVLDQKRKNHRFFSLGIACTVMNKNVKELADLVGLADELNIDVINFQPLINDNANFLNKDLPPFWLDEEEITILQQEIVKIKSYKPRHVTVYEEPKLELLIKYYRGKLTQKNWVCFGGFKTAFICFEKNQPFVYSCHGICGNMDKVSLKEAWTSREAHRLRLQSKNCKNLCMQSCYSREADQSLSNLLKLYFKNKKHE